jgi:hypothetical protein
MSQTIPVEVGPGAIPGVYVGAHASSRAPDTIIRPTLAFVLTASALKLVGAGNALLAILLVPVGLACLTWGWRGAVARRELQTAKT